MPICARSIWCRWRSSSSTGDTIRLFRTGYVAAFGATGPDDVLYAAVSEGRRHAGMEHWLPLFHKKLETLFDYVAATPLAIEPLAEEAAHQRLAQIADYFQARKETINEPPPAGHINRVCPRIEDLGEAKAFLEKTVPEVHVGVAHGQMPSAVLEDIMAAFYDGKFDVLLSTSIIESGLDIPTANTLIVHRADMFVSCADLLELRGRVGRSKLRAYALLTLPANRKITAGAERRLKVLQSLHTLGAGFQLASHDLDIRGAGNLLGDEQSGHIKEVGYELYQQMLEEAVLSMKAGITAPVADKWSPQITIGTPVYSGGLRHRPAGAARPLPTPCRD